jgi:hypothetical protein
MSKVIGKYVHAPLLILTSEQRAKLEAYARMTLARLVLLAKIVLLAAEDTQNALQRWAERHYFKLTTFFRWQLFSNPETRQRQDEGALAKPIASILPGSNITSQNVDLVLLRSRTSP